MMKRNLVGGAVGAAVVALASPFILTWEGKENRAYLDVIAVPPVWTVCAGHTGKHAVPGAVYTDFKCLEILKEDVGVHYAGVQKCIKDDEIPVSVQASILELAFNVGVGAACESTMVRLANAGDYVGACDQLDRWVKAGGKTIRGLVNRRNASQEMCLQDIKSRPTAESVNQREEESWLGSWLRRLFS